MNNVSQIKTGLTEIKVCSTSALVQSKTQKALAKVRTAETLIEQAAATLLWAQSYRAETSSDLETVTQPKP